MTTRSPQPIGGRYTPESELGRGGMGVVQLAHDTWLDRELAVKTLFENADDGARARFIEEAQVTGQLAHPNIVSIHELGLDERGGDLFMSMKLVRGQDSRMKAIVSKFFCARTITASPLGPRARAPRPPHAPGGPGDTSGPSTP